MTGPIGETVSTLEAPALYIVVDEMIGGHLTLSVAPWPSLDARGRVRFPRAQSRWRIGARTVELRRFLNSHRLPRDNATRALRIGDVFAATLVEGADLDALDDNLVEPREWIAPPVTDISADARDLVKTAFYSAVAPLLRPEENRRDEAIVQEADRSFPIEQEEN